MNRWYRPSNRFILDQILTREGSRSWRVEMTNTDLSRESRATIGGVCECTDTTAHRIDDAILLQLIRCIVAQASCLPTEPVIRIRHLDEYSDRQILRPDITRSRTILLIACIPTVKREETIRNVSIRGELRVTARANSCVFVYLTLVMRSMVHF